jgi:hypothetical protein
MGPSNLAAFLGDPNFPRIIMSATQGEKIIRFQNLYKTYSGLAFTNACDRPIAVDGIQSRLLAAFGTPGGFGVFDEDALMTATPALGQKPRGLLRRSLLWYRPPSENALVRIAFPPIPSTLVPSWSWMAYIGEIKFLKPGFGNVEWKYLRSPWSAAKGGEPGTAEGQTRSMPLSGELSNISYDDDAKLAGKLFFDRGKYDPKIAQCVVLGVEHRDLGTDMCYFILVALARGRKSSGKLYERIGAGYLQAQYITSTKSNIDIL